MNSPHVKQRKTQFTSEYRYGSSPPQVPRLALPLSFPPQGLRNHGSASAAQKPLSKGKASTNRSDAITNSHSIISHVGADGWNDGKQDHREISPLPDAYAFDNTSSVPSLAGVSAAASSLLVPATQQASCLAFAFQWCISRMCDPDKCIIDQHEVEILQGCSSSSASAASASQFSKPPRPSRQNYFPKALLPSSTTKHSPQKRNGQVSDRLASPSVQGSCCVVNPDEANAGSARVVQSRNGLNQFMLSSRLS